jgi:hypothetical protein
MDDLRSGALRDHPGASRSYSASLRSRGRRYARSSSLVAVRARSRLRGRETYGGHRIRCAGRVIWCPVRSAGLGASHRDRLPWARPGGRSLQQVIKLPGGNFQVMPRFIADYLTGFLRCRPRPRRAAPGMRPRARPAGSPRPRVGGARLAKPLREQQQAGPPYPEKRAHPATAGWLALRARQRDDQRRAVPGPRGTGGPDSSPIAGDATAGAALWHRQAGGARSPRRRCTAAIPAVSARQLLPGRRVAGRAACRAGRRRGRGPRRPRRAGTSAGCAAHGEPRPQQGWPRQDAPRQLCCASAAVDHGPMCR